MPRSSWVMYPRFTLPIQVHNLHLRLGNSRSMEKVSLLNTCSTYEQGGRQLVREEIQEGCGGRNVLGKVTHQLPKCPLVRKISKHCDLHLRAGLWVIPQWFWYSVSILCYKVPWTPPATQRQSLKKSSQRPWLAPGFKPQFPSDQPGVSCCSQRTERGGRERGGGDTAAVSSGLLDGINQFCPSASPSSSLDIRACPSGASPFSTVFFLSDVSLLHSNPPYQDCDFLQTESGPHFSWSSLQC